jgi:hypothetical protein
MPALSPASTKTGSYFVGGKRVCSAMITDNEHSFWSNGFINCTGGNSNTFTNKLLPAPAPPTPSPYHVKPGLYKGTSTSMSFHIQGSMKIRPTNLDMHFAIVIKGPPIFNVTCPGEAYVALETTISLSTFNEPDDCVGKNMREQALSIDSIGYSNVDKAIMMHIK